VELFSTNPDVAFGDVLLSEQAIRGNHNPGAGGWPTIKYFNKNTGYEGAAYTKKTSKSMCDELGNDDYMKAYVEEAGSTSLCSILTKVGCADKEVSFIDKMSTESPEVIASQIVRLQSMVEKPMKADLKSWTSARLAILKQLAARANEGKADL